MPGDGSTVCGGRCRCSLVSQGKATGEVLNVEKGAAEETYKKIEPLTPDGHADAVGHIEYQDKILRETEWDKVMSDKTQAALRKDYIFDPRLNEEEYRALRNYTSQKSIMQDVNLSVRKGKDISKEMRDDWNSMVSGIKKSKLYENTVLYRGMEASRDMQQAIKTNKITGTIITDKGIISTSTNIDKSLEFALIPGYTPEARTIMVVKAKKNHPAGYVSRLSSVPLEGEIVLPPSKFKITKAYKEKMWMRGFKGSGGVEINILECDLL